MTEPDNPDTESRVDGMHPSWYPHVLKELETRYPKIFQEITSDVVIRNAQEQVAKACTAERTTCD